MWITEQFSKYYLLPFRWFINYANGEKLKCHILQMIDKVTWFLFFLSLSILHF